MVALIHAQSGLSAAGFEARLGQALGTPAALVLPLWQSYLANEAGEVATGGDDVLSGWHAGRSLAGGAGDDTYLLGARPGPFTLTDTAGGDDTIVLAPGVTAADLTLSRSVDDLLIGIGTDGANVVRVVNHFAGSAAAVVAAVEPGIAASGRAPAWGRGGREQNRRRHDHSDPGSGHFRSLIAIPGLIVAIKFRT